MIRLALFTALLIGSLTCIEAQVKVGLKAGIANYDFGLEESLTLNFQAAEHTLAISDSKLGLNAGLFFQFFFGSFIVQPEFLYNIHSVEYVFDESSAANPQILSDKTTFVDIPLLFGIKAGPIRINGGAVGHYFLESNSDFDDLEGYESTYEDLTYGWQAGLGIDIFNLMIDVRYEGNFAAYHRHFNFDGVAYDFAQSPARLLASVAFSIN